MSADVVTATAGKELLTIALSFLGRTFLNRAFGQGSASDVRTWIRDAVEELKDFVSEELRRQLDDRALDDMQDRVFALATNLHQYANLTTEDSKPANLYLLKDASLSTAKLLPKSLRYDHAYFLTTAAIGYRLFALYELSQLHKEPGYISNAKDTVDSVVDALGSSCHRLAHKMSPEARLDTVLKQGSHQIMVQPHHRAPVHLPPEFETVYTATCFGTKDGVKVTDNFNVTGDTVLSESDLADIQRKAEEALEPHARPMRAQTSEFLERANASVLGIIDCYSKMCEAIGEVYEPPAEPGLTRRFPYLGSQATE